MIWQRTSRNRPSGDVDHIKVWCLLPTNPSRFMRHWQLMAVVGGIERPSNADIFKCLAPFGARAIGLRELFPQDRCIEQISFSA
jgi:hypothetical protein